MDDATLAAIRERDAIVFRPGLRFLVSASPAQEDRHALLAEVDSLRAREVEVHDEWAHRLAESNRLVQEHSAAIVRLRGEVAEWRRMVEVHATSPEHYPPVTPERLAAALCSTAHRPDSSEPDWCPCPQHGEMASRILAALGADR